MKLEFDRNRERYQFMKWGMQAFDTFGGVVPPGFGIVHQVNMEYLARGVHRRDCPELGEIYYPDTLVGAGFPYDHDQWRRCRWLGSRRYRSGSRYAWTAGLFPDT